MFVFITLCYHVLTQVRGTPGVYVANHVTADASRTRTMISYDQGARWQPLAAPKIDAQGNPTNCKLVSFICDNYTCVQHVCVYSMREVGKLVKL